MGKTEKIDISGLSMKALEELAIEVAERKVALKEEQREAALKSFQNIAGKYGLTPEEVLGLKRRKPRAASAQKTGEARAPVPVKYRDPETDKTWAARGRRPAWVTEGWRSSAFTWTTVSMG